jgi:hypothetical protein
MKTNIIINIGLVTIQGNPVQIHHAIDEIARAGITILTSGVVLGKWEEPEEQTLVVSGLAFDSAGVRPLLLCVSRTLSQDCIAIWEDGSGELIGDNPQGYNFDPVFFHFPAREAKPALSECQGVQTKHRAMLETLVNLHDGVSDGGNGITAGRGEG